MHLIHFGGCIRFEGRGDGKVRGITCFPAGDWAAFERQHLLGLVESLEFGSWVVWAVVGSAFTYRGKTRMADREMWISG